MMLKATTPYKGNLVHTPYPFQGMSLLLPLLLLVQLPGSSPEKICELTAVKFANAFGEVENNFWCHQFTCHQYIARCFQLNIEEMHNCVVFYP
jgi:hypothetical protein